MLVAKAFGVAKVIVTDINESRLDTALKLGADAKLNVTNMSPEVAGRKICELLESETGADAAIECSGSEPGARTAVFSTGPGGTVVLVGMGNPDFSMPMLDAEVNARLFIPFSCFSFLLRFSALTLTPFFFLVRFVEWAGSVDTRFGKLTFVVCFGTSTLIRKRCHW